MPAAHDDAQLHPGDRVDNFVIVAKLGEGGFADVYQARHADSGQIVALKMLNTEAALDRDILRRFVREAEASSLIDHPNIVRVLAYGDHARQPFLVMEFLAGETLGERVRRKGRIAPREAAAILVDVTLAIAKAHDHGIVHRDLKPDNIFLCASDGDASVTVKVLDFGVAKFRRTAPGELKTATRTIIGSLHTMSPEQCKSSNIDHRSDVYSLGVVAYYMLAGKYPFAHAHDLEICVAHLKEQPRPIRELVPAVPDALAALVHRCLEKDPARRPQSMREVRDALVTTQIGDDPRGRRRLPRAWALASGLAIVAAGGTAAWLGLRAEPAVEIVVEPADAKVTVDGKARDGAPPYRIAGKRGTRHTVACSKPGFKPAARDVTLGDGDARVTITLRPR
jgi:eukaryotic-like serine/threonine-protein kinase